MINMAPAKEAKAATTTDGTYYPDLWTEVDWGEYEEYKDVIKARNTDFLVYGHTSIPNYFVFFLNDGIYKAFSGQSIESKPASYLYVIDNIVVSDGKVVYVEPFRKHNLSFYFYDPYGSYTVVLGSTYDYRGSVSELQDLPHSNMVYQSIVLPVIEPGYSYWLYHKTTSGEYMYWSKDPFDLEVSEDKYLLNLSTGDVVYRLHMSPSHVYYRQILSSPMQYVISPGDIFRSGQELALDGITIDAWTGGDVTSEEVEEQYSIPYITKFLDRVRGIRSPNNGPREYFMTINLALSGDFDAAVTEKKVLVDGSYIMPSEKYFLFCDSASIEPSMSHFMDFVKNKEEGYYVFIDWDHTDLIVSHTGNISDYGFRLNYSGAVDALIERGEFNDLYSESIRLAYEGDIRRLCCPYRLACTLIGVIDGEYYYGDTYITVLYSELDKTIEDVSGVYSDYVTLDNDQRTDAIESTINGAQDDQMQDYIDRKDAELDALIEEYEMKLATLDTTISRIENGSSDLFGTFSSVVDGISNLSGSFRKIGMALGNVFSFFPEELTMLLIAGFIVHIIISLYKLIQSFRGGL